MRVRKSRREPPQKIGSLVDGLLAESGYATICKEYGVVHKWPDIVDARFAEVTRADRVENGILYVKVLSAPWRQEATYRKEQLLESIRKEHGCTTLKDIVFY